MHSFQKLLVIIFVANSLFARGEEREHITTIYSSLDPKSVSQNFAFYDLYPNTDEGKKALQRGWSLLLKDDPLKKELMHPLSLPPCDVQAIIALVNKQTYTKNEMLSFEQLEVIDKLSSRLSNRKLAGYKAESLQELNALEPQEIDIARSILLHQFQNIEDIKQYEANLDLMALQILARLPKEATDEDKIRAINYFIFHEMQFRFPPHSLYAKDIDLYTFLPSVIDSRQGVCLGVSILFLSMAQRLDLPLEIVTPPGHIYLRHRDENKVINIETTARGIDLPSEMYLGINTKSLHLRNMKEVIGLSLVNQASVSWSRGDYKTTVELYEKAQNYLKDDKLLKMLLGMNYLFIGEKEKGKKLFSEIKGIAFDDAVYPDSIPEDYLNGKVDVEGLKTIFLPVDETRDSILQKQKELKNILQKHPKFRAGLLQFATTWLQLGRRKEALECLSRYHKIDANDPTIEYYLVHLHLQSFDYPSAWKHFERVKEVTSKHNHYPKALKQLEQELMSISPKAKESPQEAKNSFLSFFNS